MPNPLIRLHRFLLNQTFYPILLSSLLAMLIYTGRVYLSRSFLVYSNLVWNLFLAWLPYLISIFAAGIHRLFPRFWWMLLPPAALWLIFFPNAAYILTDFLHLEQRPRVPLWYDIFLLATFAWTGIFLAVASLRTMQSLTRYYLGWLLSWLFVAVALGLSALGIYLGRFERWNSWDLLIHPRRILADVVTRLANPFAHKEFIAFTALFTAFLLVCYLMFISLNRIEEPEV